MLADCILWSWGQTKMKTDSKQFSSWNALLLPNTWQNPFTYIIIHLAFISCKIGRSNHYYPISISSEMEKAQSKEVINRYAQGCIASEWHRVEPRLCDFKFSVPSIHLGYSLVFLKGWPGTLKSLLTLTPHILLIKSYSQ